MRQHGIITKAFWFWTTSLLLAVVGCSGDSVTTGSDENVGQAQLALRTEQLRILGFEAPTSDWTTTLGTLSDAPVHSQGQKALAVTRPQDWTEVCTPPLSSLGDVGDTVNFDLWMQDTTPTFGEVQIIARAPSLGLWNNPLPSVNIQQKSAGSFHTISSPLGSLSGPLSGSYSDLTLCVVINAEPGTYVLDNLTFSGSTTSTESTSSTTTDGSGGTTSSGGATSTGGTTSTTDGSGGTGADGGTGGSTSTTGSGGTGGSGGSGGTGGSGGSTTDPSQCIPETADWDQLVLHFPRGVPMDEVAIGAQGGTLYVNDGVSILKADGSAFANLSNLSPDPNQSGPTELGAHAQAQNIVSGRNVNLRSNAHVHGFVETSQWVSEQTGAVVDGSRREGVQLQPYEEVRIPYQFPDILDTEPGVIQDGGTTTLPPAGYAATVVQNQSTLHLGGAGSYYFESLRVEPGSALSIDNGQGAVLIFVQGELSLKVTPSFTNPSQFNVLFAVTGTGPVTVDANLRGTLVAPMATVSLPTGNSALGHQGSLFASSITLHQVTDFFHHPFDRDDCNVVDPEGLGGVFGCAPRDSDGDSLSDCDEDTDSDPWTDKYVFNGAHVRWADACHASATPEDIDTQAGNRHLPGHRHAARHQEPVLRLGLERARLCEPLFLRLRLPARMVCLRRGLPGRRPGRHETRARLELLCHRHRRSGRIRRPNRRHPPRRGLGRPAELLPASG